MLASALPISPRVLTELITDSDEIISKSNNYFQVANGNVRLYGEKDTIFLKAADRFNNDAPPDNAAAKCTTLCQRDLI